VKTIAHTTQWRACFIYNQFLDAIWVVGVVCKIYLTVPLKLNKDDFTSVLPKLQGSKGMICAK